MTASEQSLPEMKAIIEQFSMVPHPEGGFYSETYRSSTVFSQETLGEPYNGDRNASTAIYYMLPAGTVSKFHKLYSDEVLHFYLGGPMVVLVLNAKEGTYQSMEMGPHILNGQVVQLIVPAGSWFGMYPKAGYPYSLIGCTVAPGFDPHDFKFAKKSDLLPQFSALEEAIKRLT